MQLQNLGSVHLAFSAVGQKSRLCVGPTSQCLGPLRGTSHVESIHAQRDHRAVGDPGDLRYHSIGDGVDHDLVQSRKGLGLVALDVETPSTSQASQYEEIII